MRVEIIHHDYDLVRLRILLGEQFVDEVHPIFSGASSAHVEVALVS